MIRVLLAILWSACLIVSCYNVETDTPYWAIQAILFAFALGGLIVDTMHQSGQGVMKRTANKTFKVAELIRGLEYQHPLAVSTFSPCMKCKTHAARGGSTCAQCLEEELGELIGRSLAWEVHQALKTYNLLKTAALYGDEDESKNQEAAS